MLKIKLYLGTGYIKDWEKYKVCKSSIIRIQSRLYLLGEWMRTAEGGGLEIGKESIGGRRRRRKRWRWRKEGKVFKDVRKGA